MDKQETIEEAKLRAANYMSLKGALEPKQETLEEAAKSNYDKKTARLPVPTSHWINSEFLQVQNFIEGAKWMKEQMYSEEDMREAYFTAIRSTGEGWNGEYAGNGSLSIEKTFNDGYEMFIEQYKNKIK